MTSIKVTPSGQACGASVTGVDLTQPLDAQQVADIRTTWLEHHVLSFPDQAMTLAAIHRLVHHATILEMNVESYRRKAALDRKRGPGRPATHATSKKTEKPDAD